MEVHEVMEGHEVMKGHEVMEVLGYVKSSLVLRPFSLTQKWGSTTLHFAKFSEHIPLTQLLATPDREV